jgi:hypothetical protein
MSSKRKSTTHFRHARKRNELSAPAKFPEPPTPPLDEIIEEAIDLICGAEEDEESE